MRQSDLMNILANGISIIVDAKGKSPNDLIGLAVQAKSTGATVTIRNAKSLQVGDLVAIGAQAKNNVVLDLT